MSAIPVPANGAHPTPEAILSAASSDDPIALGQIMARSGLFPDIRRVSQAIVRGPTMNEMNRAVMHASTARNVR